jgi:hypothetical protein
MIIIKQNSLILLSPCFPFDNSSSSLAARRQSPDCAAGRVDESEGAAADVVGARLFRARVGSASVALSRGVFADDRGDAGSSSSDGTAAGPASTGGGGLKR